MFHFTASHPSVPPPLIFSSSSSPVHSPSFSVSLYICLSTWLAILSGVPEGERLRGSLAGCQLSTREQGTCMVATKKALTPQFSLALGELGEQGELGELALLWSEQAKDAEHSKGGGKESSYP